MIPITATYVKPFKHGRWMAALKFQHNEKLVAAVREENLLRRKQSCLAPATVGAGSSAARCVGASGLPVGARLCGATGYSVPTASAVELRDMIRETSRREKQQLGKMRQLADT